MKAAGRISPGLVLAFVDSVQTTIRWAFRLEFVITLLVRTIYYIAPLPTSKTGAKVVMVGKFLVGYSSPTLVSRFFIWEFSD